MSKKHQVMIWEKSRRIGATWADAALSALDAAVKTGTDTYYVGTNKEMTLDYIENVAYWARAYQLVASEIYEDEVIGADDESILAFSIRFESGFKVSALSSKPSALRGKQGNVVIDEAAFVNDLDEVRKAAMALLMWGGQIRYISTHNGVDNPFNMMIKEVKEGKLNYYIQRTTLKRACEDSLYKRICLVTKQHWTLEGEFKWYSDLYSNYGVGADEELGCIPADIKGGGKLFKREWFTQFVDFTDIPLYADRVRFFDMAATARDIKEDAFYTAGIRMSRYDDKYFVEHLVAEQLSPSEGDDLIVETARDDGKFVPCRWELEGGSAGLKVEAYLKERLFGYDAAGIRPMGDKVARAKPVASEAKRGNVYLVRGHWNQQFIDSVYGFDGTPKILINDVTDSLSGAYDVLQNTINPMIGT